MNRFLYSILIVILICSFSNSGITGEIHEAVKKNQLKEVKKYVERGDIELPDKNGLTPLLVAAYYGHTAVVKYLCQEGARVNADDNKGWTALMFAAYYNYLEIGKILLAHNADKKMKNPKGYTAYDYAKKYGHHDIARLLEPVKPKVKIEKTPVAELSSTPDNRYKLAIFPWNLSEESGIDLVLDTMVEYVNTEKDFKLYFSYYETGQSELDKKRSLIKIDKSFIWGRGKPNLINICELGKKLKVDSVLVGGYDIKSDGVGYFGRNLELYIVDVNNEKLFSYIPPDKFLDFDRSIQKIFKKYKDGVLK